MRLLMIASLLLCACEPGTKGSAPAGQPVAQMHADKPNCTDVRAEYFRREQIALIATGGEAGGGGPDPVFRSLLAQYKLDHKECFFANP